MWPNTYWPKVYWPNIYWPFYSISIYIPKCKYDVSIYDRNFEVSEYNRASRIEKDISWKIKDVEG